MFTAIFINWFLLRVVSSNLFCKMLRCSVFAFLGVALIFLLCWEALSPSDASSGDCSQPQWTFSALLLYSQWQEEILSDGGLVWAQNEIPTPLHNTVTFPVIWSTSSLAGVAQGCAWTWGLLVQGLNKHTGLFCFKGFPANHREGAAKVTHMGKLQWFKKSQKSSNSSGFIVCTKVFSDHFLFML